MDQREETKRQRYLLVEEITQALGDPVPKGSEPWWGYYYVIKLFADDELVRRLVREAVDQQAAGGMMTKDGSRPRSTGGIFFSLCKKQLKTLGPRAKGEPYRSARWKYGKQVMLQRLLQLLAPDWPSQEPVR